MQQKDAVFTQSPSVCNKLFRKDTVKNYKFLSGCMWEDIVFSFTRFLEADTVVDVPTTNYFFRRDTSSGVSAKNFQDNNKLDDIFVVADELEEELKRAGKYDDFAPQVRALQIGVCLQRVNEIRQWNSPTERIEEATEYMFSKMKEKYGTLEELDEIAIQCKAGFKVTDDYKEYLEKEGTKMQEDKIETFVNIIKNSKSTAFFGGAGVSTESGLKDFRSKDGLYHEKYKYPPEEILSHHFFLEHAEEFFQFYKDKLNSLNYAPNIAHKVLAKLEQKRILDTIITQNIDGFHQMAGSKT